MTISTTPSFSLFFHKIRKKSNNNGEIIQGGRKMSENKKNLSANDKANRVENKSDYGSTDNRVPKEVEEEFFPEPKKHPDVEYLD
jgi:hypothetical protein